MNLPKPPLKGKLFIVAILAFIVVFLGFTFLFLKNKKERNSFPMANEQGIVNLPTRETSFWLPMRLEIPKINVDAVVDYVGLASDGAMDVPEGPSDVAWFDLGPRPGEKGSSVIDGHSGWKDGTQAVFDNLYKLQKGDKIYVKDVKGTTASFVIREIRTYDPQADASSVFGSTDGNAHLNLITCTGTWDKITQSHSERLVVFADEETK